MQEKFQITPPQQEETDHQWADFNKQRLITRVKDTSAKVEFSEYGGPSTMAMSHNNEMPPGYNITEQHGAIDNFTPIYLAGTKDVTDNPTGKDLGRGFVKGKMSPTDDLYTDEHKDDFYDEVEVDGVVGFVERANYLDRA